MSVFSDCYRAVNKLRLHFTHIYCLNGIMLKEVGSQGRIPGQILIMHFSNLTCLIEWRNVLQEHTELFTEYVKGYS